MGGELCAASVSGNLQPINQGADRSHQSALNTGIDGSLVTLAMNDDSATMMHSQRSD